MSIAILSRRRRSSLAQRIVSAAGGSANVAATFLYGVRTTVAGGTLSAWADASGGAPTISQATGSKQPIDSGSDYVFDGVDDVIKGTFTLAQPTTLFLVVNQVTWVSGRYLADGGVLNHMAVIQRTVSPGLQTFAGAFGPTSNDTVVGVYQIVSAIFSGASSDLQVNDGTAGTGNPNAQGASGLTLANSQNETTPGNVAFKAIVMMNVAASAGQRAAVKSVLHSAYGITP